MYLEHDLNEADLIAQEEAIARRRAELVAQKAAAAEAERQKQTAIYQNLLQDAKNYRSEAAQATDQATKLLLLHQAADVTAEANRLGVELGILQSPDAETDPDKKRPYRWGTAFIQLGGLLAVIAWCYGRFFDLKATIEAYNQKVEPFSQVRPYGLDSIQKVFFEKMVLCTDLLALLGVVGIIAPSVLLYLLPFTGSNHDLSHDFKTELTAWQRVCISVSLVLGLFLCLGLSHLVKA